MPCTAPSHVDPFKALNYLGADVERARAPDLAQHSLQRREEGADGSAAGPFIGMVPHPAHDHACISPVPVLVCVCVGGGGRTDHGDESIDDRRPSVGASSSSKTNNKTARTRR